jgi:hypothetical protein
MQDPSVVYFVRQGRKGPVKIGTTTRIYERLKELETGTSFRLRLLASEPGDRDRERELHRRFAPAHMRGEWFWPTPELVDYIRSIGGNMENGVILPLWSPPKFKAEDMPQPEGTPEEIDARVKNGARMVLAALLGKDKK